MPARTRALLAPMLRTRAAVAGAALAAVGLVLIVLAAENAPNENNNVPDRPWGRHLSDRVLWHDCGLVLREGSQRLLVEVQVGLDQLGRSQRHPLVERDVGEAVASEHLEEAERLVAGVLDVVAHGERDVADVARLVVERPRLAAGGKYGHPPAS